MTTTGIADPAVRFWLDYIEAEGGLCDVDGDKALAVLPQTVRDHTGLPEEVTVTADPEVARDEGALLLIPGHPALDHAVEDVLGRGDVVRSDLEWPCDPVPSGSALLPRARANIVVDHGRIDLGLDAPSSAYLPVLRLGVAVTYWTSLEDRFQESAEVWVDGRIGVALPEAISQTLRAAPRAAGKAAQQVLDGDLRRAIQGAHARIEETATARRLELARHSRRAREQEIVRAAAYYDAALDSIARRSGAADAERRTLLEAQAEATRVERARRLKEIYEKFRPRQEIRPFRLHLVHVPVVQLPVVIRRGPREYPFDLTWVPCASAFLPMICPECADSETLVVGKHGLGCRACLEHAACAPPVRFRQPEPALPPDPAATHATVEPNAASSSHKACSSEQARPKRKGAAGPGRPARPQPSYKGSGAGTVEKAGDKLARALWRSAFEERKWRAKAMVPHSPMSAMTKLYGPDAALRAVGFTPGALPIPQMVEAHTSPGRANRAHSTTGIVWGTDRRAYLFTLRWRKEAGTAMLADALVGIETRDRELPRRHDLPPDIGSRVFEGAPASRIDLDPVARALWDAAIASHGLPFVARCLCVWWRIASPDLFERHLAPALAAATMTWVAERSGLRGDVIPVAAPEIDAGAVAAAEAALEERVGPEAVTW